MIKAFSGICLTCRHNHDEAGETIASAGSYAEEITRLRAENKSLHRDHRIQLDALVEKDDRIETLKKENKRLKDTLDLQFPGLVEVSKDAERYRWGLKHPSLMANYFIKWKTKHDHYNHRNPGVHPSEAIDAAMEADDE